LWVAGIDDGCPFLGNLLLKPIMEVAGQDISHWFDPKTRDVSSTGTWGWAGDGGGVGEALERGNGEEKREYPESEIVTAPTPLRQTLP
jgi:hypothetical protein